MIIKNINNFKYKIKYLVFSLILFFLLFFAIFLIRSTNSSYKTSTNLAIKPDFAAFVFEEGMFKFNLDTIGIKPSNKDYVYSFTIANYNSKKESDVDLIYTINISTTTNLPLEYKLYKDEDYTLSTSVNLLNDKEIVQDEDGSWYNEYKVDKEYEMYYSVNTKHTYYLVITFKEEYGNNVLYADLIDNIRINIKSRQIIN